MVQFDVAIKKLSVESPDGVDSFDVAAAPGRDPRPGAEERYELLEVFRRFAGRVREGKVPVKHGLALNGAARARKVVSARRAAVDLGIRT